MYGRPKRPLDRTPHPRSSDGRPLRPNELPGRYAFVVDLRETIHVVPDGPHVHPRVLGGGREALYAGEIVIGLTGVIEEVTNLSGTFRFRSKKSLCCVVAQLRRLGYVVANVTWYPPDGSTGPQVLQCP